MGNIQGAEDRGEEIQDCREDSNTACWRGYRYGSAILSTYAEPNLHLPIKFWCHAALCGSSEQCPT